MIPPSVNNDELVQESITAHIIFNLANLGLSIDDSRFFDIKVYMEILKLQGDLLKKENTRRATQADIDAFLL